MQRSLFDAPALNGPGRLTAARSAQDVGDRQTDPGAALTVTVFATRCDWLEKWAGSVLSPDQREYLATQLAGTACTNEEFSQAVGLWMDTQRKPQLPSVQDLRDGVQKIREGAWQGHNARPAAPAKPTAEHLADAAHSPYRRAVLELTLGLVGKPVTDVIPAYRAFAEAWPGRGWDHAATLIEQTVAVGGNWRQIPPGVLLGQPNAR